MQKISRRVVLGLQYTCFIGNRMFFFNFVLVIFVFIHFFFSLFFFGSTIILCRVKTFEAFEAVSCSYLPKRQRFRQEKRRKNGNSY